MPRKPTPHITSLLTVIPFVQGYRYLDRCGEAIIKLEKVLDEHWIPSEPKPTGGIMQNYKLGMAAEFSSAQLKVQQQEFISFEHFRDQASRIYETLWKVFEIDRIISPSFSITLQTGFDSTDEADRYIHSMGIASFDEQIVSLMGGVIGSTTHVLCTEKKREVYGTTVQQRRRIEIRAIKQAKQPDFDSRVAQRVALIPTRHQPALQALLAIKRLHPHLPLCAAEFNLNNEHQGEVRARTFSLGDLADETLKWVTSIQNWIAKKDSSEK